MYLIRPRLNFKRKPGGLLNLTNPSIPVRSNGSAWVPRSPPMPCWSPKATASVSSSPRASKTFFTSETSPDPIYSTWYALLTFQLLEDTLMTTCSLFKSIQMPRVLYDQVIEVEERVIPHKPCDLDPSRRTVELGNKQSV